MLDLINYILLDSGVETLLESLSDPNKEYIKAKFTENYSRLDDKECVIVDKMLMLLYIEDIYSGLSDKILNTKVC